MKRTNILLAFLAVLAFNACKNGQQETETETETETTTEAQMTEETQDQTKKVTVELKPVSGSDLSGNVVFTEENNEVTMVATITGLSEGTHAIHLHEKADCSAEDGTSAGGHWNPSHEKHGKWSDPEGHHKGDIGNFTADASGTGTISMTTDKWCLGCDDNTKNILGTAVIVHEGTDDFTSQPSGAAGTRIGCGEVKM